MKKILLLLAVLAPAMVWAGCKKAEPTKPAPPKDATAPQTEEPAKDATSATDAAPAAVTLVSLKVPNMT